MLIGAQPPRTAALRVAVIYAVVGAAWILFSDSIVEILLTPETVRAWHVQTIKGWAFIAVTAVMLYMVTRRTFMAVRASAEAHRQVEQRTRLLVEQVRDYAIFTLDPAGVVTSWNRGAQQITDWLEADVLGKHFGVFYTKSDAEAGRPKQHLEEANDLGWSEDEGLRLRHDGSRFRASQHLTAVRDEASNLTGFLCVLRDVTERRRAQDALQRVNQVLTSVIEASPLPIITLDAATNVLGWNPAAEKMFGWTASEVIGKPLPTIPDAERETFREMLREQSGGGKIAGRELVRQRKDGSVIHVSLWTAPLTDSGGNLTGVLGIFVELPDRKHAAGD
jgi:PAS domain S-box-containing protein